MTSQRSTRRLVKPILIAAVLLGAWAYPSAASADTLYAANGGSNNLASLHTLNPSTGASTPVGPITIGATQQRNVTGLAVRPTDGALYGFMNAPTNDRTDPTFEDGTLLAINKANGDATAVGSIGAN